MSITVVVADDEPLVRGGITLLLRALPEVEIVAECGDGTSAIDAAKDTRCDIVVMDVRMPGTDGITATRMLTADPPPGTDADILTKVLILTTFDDDEAVYGALRAGASGFLLKHTAPRDLGPAIRSIAAGGGWIDPLIAPKVIAAVAGTADGDEFQPPPPAVLERLTVRELEVLSLMAHGMTNQIIKDRLVLSEATVKTHVSRILMKTGSRDRSQAVVLAYQAGLVLPERRPPLKSPPGKSET